MRWLASFKKILEKLKGSLMILRIEGLLKVSMIMRERSGIISLVEE
jgi:hypothetical protein